MITDNRGSHRTKSKSRLPVLGIAGILITMGALAGCVSDDGGNGGGDAKTLTMAVPSWTGEEIRSYMIQNILEEELGYTVKMNTAMEVAPAYQSVASGSADIFVGAWLPIQQAQYDKVKDDLVHVNDNLQGEDVTFNFAVPKYVTDEGVTSFLDLKDPEVAEKFGKQFIGLDAGAGMSITALEHIENNLYGLGDWEYVQASEAAMLAQYDKAVKNGDWVIVAAWSPHYMFAKWTGDQQMVYLEDPGDPEQDGQTWYADSSKETRVATLVSTNLDENHPDARAFLENFKMDPAAESELMLKVNQGESTKDVALQFIEDNPETVQEWLSGVNTE